MRRGLRQKCHASKHVRLTGKTAGVNVTGFSINLREASKMQVPT
jgi:hypothetical protein